MAPIGSFAAIGASRTPLKSVLLIVRPTKGARNWVPSVIISVCVAVLDELGLFAVLEFWYDGRALFLRSVARQQTMDD
jgi:hypothetical protein